MFLTNSGWIAPHVFVINNLPTNNLGTNPLLSSDAMIEMFAHIIGNDQNEIANIQENMIAWH